MALGSNLRGFLRQHRQKSTETLVVLTFRSMAINCDQWLNNCPEAVLAKSKLPQVQKQGFSPLFINDKNH
jgi:hypothetical protein